MGRQFWFYIGLIVFGNILDKIQEPKRKKAKAEKLAGMINDVLNELQDRGRACAAYDAMFCTIRDFAFDLGVVPDEKVTRAVLFMEDHLAGDFNAMHEVLCNLYMEFDGLVSSGREDRC